MFSFLCIILKRSLVQVNIIIFYFGKTFFYHRIRFLFYCIWEYIHNDVVKNQTTRNKPLGIVLTHILMFDLEKHNILSQFSIVFMRMRIHCQKLGVVRLNPPFVCYNKKLFFWISDEGIYNFSQTYIQCIYFWVCWYNFEHIGEHLLKNDWVILKCIPYFIITHWSFIIGYIIFVLQYKINSVPVIRKTWWSNFVNTMYRFFYNLHHNIVI